MENDVSHRPLTARESADSYVSLLKEAEDHVHEIIAWHAPTFEIRLNVDRELEALSHDKVLREQADLNEMPDIVDLTVAEIFDLNDQRLYVGSQSMMSLTGDLIDTLETEYPDILIFPAIERPAGHLERMEDLFADAQYQEHQLDIATGATYAEYLDDIDPDAAPIADYELIYVEVSLHTSYGLARATRIKLIKADIDLPLLETITADNLNGIRTVSRSLEPANASLMSTQPISPTLRPYDRELQNPFLDDLLEMNRILALAE